MFEVTYKVVEHLPKLAWLVEIDKNTSSVIVYAGKKVECHDKFFVTGVWDGDFQEGRFDVAEFNLSTGAVFSADGIKFVTPSHALERLLLSEDENKYTVSNSLPLILAYNDFALDEKIDQYEGILCSLLKGTEKMTCNIPLKDGKYIRQYIVSLITIKEDMSVQVERRPFSKKFVTYVDYYKRLMDSMKRIRENSTSLFRKNSGFDLCSTISSGYDSCANAAIAKSIGCDKALALSGGSYDLDTGEEVAKQLGYKNVIKRDRYSYKEKKGCIDAEYNASGELSKHLQFSVFEDVFKDSLVFMGTRGDYYWGMETIANNNFEMVGFYTFEMDISYTENALRNGYIFVPVATYGATASDSIRRIMLSEEMKPWVLGNDYDRPIPRRILEDMGVSRESFGQKKYGGGFSFCYDTMKTLKNKMSHEGYEMFCEYQRNHKRIYSFTRMLHWIQYRFSVMPTCLNVLLRKVGIPGRIHQKPTKLTNPSAPSDLLHWSVGYMVEKYRGVLQRMKAEI